MKLSSHPLRFLLLFSLFALIGATPGSCRVPGLYALEEGSSFARGCFDGPCRCPVSLAPLRGTFQLEKRESDEAGFRHFAVPYLRWVVGSGEHASTVVGKGQYRIARRASSNDPDTRPEAKSVHELALVLQKDGATGEFESGLVEGGFEFPERIDIEVSIPDAGCFNVVYTIRARQL